MSFAVIALGCAAFLAVVLYAEKTGNDRLRYIFKPLASACFILVAVLGAAIDGDGAVGRWILVGLVFGAIGDVLLMVRGRRGFLAGLVAFLIGHLCYVVAFAQVVPIGDWITPHAALPVIAAAGIVVWLWRHLGRMRGPVLVYIAVIASMMIGALAVMAAGDDRLLLDDGEARRLVTGAALFFASALAVARQRFIAEGFINRLWGLPAYYAGQMLLAMSAIT